MVDFFDNSKALEFQVKTADPEEYFRIVDGEVFWGDKNVTDDDAALANCFRIWAEVHGCPIRPGVREGTPGPDDDLDEDLGTPGACGLGAECSDCCQ